MVCVFRRYKNNTYTMMLDHNAIPYIIWNSDNKNYDITDDRVDLKVALQDVVNNSKWKVTPRIISMEEIVDIVGEVPSSWDASNINS